MTEEEKILKEVIEKRLTEEFAKAWKEVCQPDYKPNIDRIPFPELLQELSNYVHSEEYQKLILDEVHDPVYVMWGKNNIGILKWDEMSYEDNLKLFLNDRNNTGNTLERGATEEID